MGAPRPRTRIHTVLSDNGVQFARLQPGQSRTCLIHILERVCLENGIEHRLTRPYPLWTNGQAERMVRTTKDATVNPSTTPQSRNCDDTSATD